MRLSAPSADQFLKGGFELARLARPERKVDFDAPVVLASAPAPERRKPSSASRRRTIRRAGGRRARALLHEASLKTETREVPARPVVNSPDGRQIHGQTGNSG